MSIYSVKFPAVTPASTSPLSQLSSFLSLEPNYIRTTKYTLLTFIPLNLFGQFKRLYNIYFLIAALSTLLGYSSFSPITQILPLALVLFAAACKDAIEDISRYKQDTKANNAKTILVRDSEKQSILAKNICPGDIVYFEKNDKFPVDAIVLSTSVEDGSCFVDTAELDGETNLKRRSACHEFLSLSNPSALSSFAGAIQCEPPNQNLLAFQDFVTPIGLNNLLLRGAVLRNTDYCYALVLYTGANTKIMKNLKKARQKTSNLERSLNKFVFAAFIFNLVLLISSVLLELATFYRERANQIAGALRNPGSAFIYQWYLGIDTTTIPPQTQIFTDVLSYFAVYTYVIPISLFVTLEIARLVQGLFMRWDVKMMHTRYERDGTPIKQYMRPNNTNLNEDLGMVEYVFSDKTGTLTRNEMVLARYFVNGFEFDEISPASEARGDISTPAHDANNIPSHDATPLGGGVAEALRTGLAKDGRQIDPLTREYLVLFLRTLALAHDVLPSLDEDGKTIIYESASPDETALLNSAAQNSFTLLSKSKSVTTISTHIKYPSPTPEAGELCAGLGNTTYTPDTINKESYTPLATLEFSSDRKRMSVIVKTPDGRIHIYTKGADNIILSLLDSAERAAPMLAQAEAAVGSFSENGFRTLMLAWRQLDETEYTAFQSGYDEAIRMLDPALRESALAKACEGVESGLRFLGCTAIEDKLQDQVPETIAYLLEADIKVWLLTGDKLETAINIGFSSRLLNTGMKMHTLRGADSALIVRELESIHQSIITTPSSTQQHALVVDGDALAVIFSSPEQTQLLFLNTGTQCRSVICCRVTPLQKAKVVKLVKSNIKCITLSIGDGANDVSMIQAANIGIGIMGREGTQAVRAADYAFAEFRFLKRLIAIHGRASYMRIATIIMFSFYKNLVMICIFWWFGWVNLFSGQIPFEEIFMTLYNVALLSLPPFVMCVFDRDVNDEYIERYPQLYRQVRHGAFWNWQTVGGWMVSALWQCTAVYFIDRDGSISATGRTTGYWIQTSLLGSSLLLTVLLKFLLATKTFVWPTWASIGLSIALNEIALWILEIFGYSEIGTGVIGHISPVYYLTCVLIPVMANMGDLVVMYVKRQVYPHDADIICEEQKVARLSIVAPGDDIELLKF